MTTRNNFHFTIGPVQEFVAQARRTRDFWAGSFLLSTLSAVAMREVQAQGGEILFPQPDEGFMDALNGRAGERPPKQGVVPNRFKASVGETFVPAAVCEAIRRAWLGIARLAWMQIPRELRDEHRGLRRVWSRQIGVDLAAGNPHKNDPFWRFAWALGDEGDGEDLLDRRKSIRLHRKPDEPGSKCMLMDGWQELSGTATENVELARFWSRLHDRINLRNKSDLREDERLCALSLVKRLFPYDFARLTVDMPGGWVFHGWELDTNVPSSAYLAATPWLARVIELIDEPLAQEFYQVAIRAGQSGEARTRLQIVQEAALARGEHAASLAKLDGDLFFDSSLANTLEFPESTLSGPVRAKLKQLCRLEDPSQGPGATVGEPDPYFAVLAMDGDELGKQMADPAKQQTISAALARFTTAVPGIVDEHSGFLVYAGGDDVIALFPVPEALPAARALRSAYASSFAGSPVRSTLSAGLLFASHKLPLTHVLRSAHALLDDIAKEARGRDAIAIQVTSRGGELVRWAQPWQVGQAESGLLALEDLAQQMATGQAPFSNSFFHRIETLLRLVNPDRARGTEPLDDETATDLFTAELLDSSLYRDAPQAPEAAAAAASTTDPPAIARARGHVETLLDQCRPRKRLVGRAGDTIRYEPYPSIEADGAFLVRFLARRQRRTQAQ